VFSSKEEDKIETPASKWSIGIYTGTSPFEFQAPDSILNPVLTANDVTDAIANFVADPFMIYADSTWYMFFEVDVIENQGNIGKIGLASSHDGFKWNYEKIVIEEPFHLSYPYVFQWGTEYYLIPETRAIRSIQLYRAIEFPFEWKFERTLIKKRRFADASIFRYNDLWWIFTDSGKSTLRLYSSKSLDGKWIEHSKSPVIKKKISIARPGGRVLVIEDQVIRYTQDCYPYYGRQVWAFKIKELTAKTYKEEKHNSPIITPGTEAWNKFGMHTIDPHQLSNKNWIACVDGFGNAK